MRVHLSIMLLSILAATYCSARTWRVEQDGSGEFLNIQDAANVAAPGDTVFVGPGRYDQYREIRPGWETIVEVATDSLTLIGTDRDAVFIGGIEPYPNKQNDVSGKRITAHGIVSGGDNNWLVVESMTIENMDFGVRCHPGGAVRNCRFRHIHYGAVFSDNAENSWPDFELLVEDCDVMLSDGTGVQIQYSGNGETSAVVRRLSIHDADGPWAAGEGVYSTHPNLTIEDCHFDRARVGIQIEGGAATATSCVINGSATGISVDGILECRDVRVNNSTDRDAIIYGSFIADSCSFSGHGSYATLWSFRGGATVRDSHILNNG